MTRSSRSVAACLFVLALVAAACGTTLELSAPEVAPVDATTGAPIVDDEPTAAEDSTPTSQPDPTAEPEPTPTSSTEGEVEDEPDVADDAPIAETPDGFQLVEEPGRYRLAAPEDWQVLTDPQDVEELMAIGLDVAGVEESQVEGLLAQLDSEGSVVVLGANGDNLNVLVLPMGGVAASTPPGVYEALLESQFSTAAGFEDLVVDASRSTIGGADAILADASYSLVGETLYLTQALVDGSDATYVLSVTTATENDPVAAAIVESFTVD